MRNTFLLEQQPSTWKAAMCIVLLSVQFLQVASHIEYIGEPTTSLTDFSISTFQSGSFNNLMHNDLTKTGISTEDSDSDPELKVNFADSASSVGSVFVFTDPSMIQGDLKIYLHSSEHEVEADLQGTLTYGEGGGGVLNLSAPINAQYVTIKCDACLPSMRINMLKVFSDQVISTEVTPQAYITQPSLFDSAWNLKPSLTGLGSQYDAFQVLMISHLHDPVLLIDFQGRQSIMNVLVISANTGQSGRSIKIEVFENLEDIDTPTSDNECGSAFQAGYQDVSCSTKRGRYVVVRPSTNGTDLNLSLSKVIVFGVDCQVGNLRLFNQVDNSKQLFIDSLDAKIENLPDFKDSCDQIVRDFTVTLFDKSDGQEITWIQFLSDSDQPRLSIQPEASLMKDIMARNPIQFQIAAYPFSDLQTNFGTGANGDVTWELNFQYMECDDNFSIVLADDSWVTEPIYTFTHIGDSVTFAIPAYEYYCNLEFYGRNLLTTVDVFNYEDELNDAPWIQINEITPSEKELIITPTQQAFIDYEGDLLNIFIRAAQDDFDTSPMTLNMEVVFLVMITTQIDLHCPNSSIQVAAQTQRYVFTMPENGDANQEVFIVPEAPDSASINYLSDPTGLIGCGDRVYQVMTNTDFLYIDSLTLELSLYSSVTESDSGSYESVVKVYLADYPSVEAQFKLQFDIRQEGSDQQDDSEPEIPDEDKDSDGDENETDQDNESDVSPIDPNCQVKWLVNFLGQKAADDQKLPKVIELPDPSVTQYPVELTQALPLYSPMPFCGYTFADVSYSLETEGSRWIKHNVKEHTFGITIQTEDDQPKRSFSSCLKSTLATANLKKAALQKCECFRVVPFGYDEKQIFDDILEENGVIIDEDEDEDNDDDDGKDDDDSEKNQPDELFLNEKALQEQWMKEFQKQYSTDKEISELNNLKFKIKSISAKGEVIITFSEPVFEFQKLNSQEINVQYCGDKDCEGTYKKDESKDWVQVSVIAGESSDASKLQFGSDIFFKDSEKMQINLVFKNAIDVSLFSDEDKLQVQLWGPFLSARNLAPIAQEDRTQIKQIPPQIHDDLASMSLNFLIEEDVITGATLSSLAANTAKNLLTRGSLNNVFSMLTGMQLIVHSPLINVQFPAIAFSLYEELIKVATYELLPTEELFPLFMDLPDLGYFNEKFQRLDYGYFYSTMNLGFMFLVFLFNLALYPVFLILWLLKLKFTWPTNLVNYMYDILFWQQFVFFAHATFIEIVIGILLQNQILDSPWMVTNWVFISYILWICLIVQAAYVLGLFLFYLWPNFKRFATDEVFLKKHSQLIEVLNYENGSSWCMIFQVSYFVRRIVLPMVAIYLNHDPTFQIFILIGVDLFACVIQSWAQPLKNPSDNKRALYDDFSLLLIIDCLLCCTDLIRDSSSKYAVGFLILALTLQNILCNLVLLFIDPIRKVKLLVKKCRNIRNATNGKTMSYAKRSVKQKIRKKWRNLKGLVTSSESNIQLSQRSYPQAESISSRLGAIKEESSKEEMQSDDEILEDFSKSNSYSTNRQPQKNINARLINISASANAAASSQDTFREQCSLREQDSLRVLNRKETIESGVSGRVSFGASKDFPTPKIVLENKSMLNNMTVTQPKNQLVNFAQSGSIEFSDDSFPQQNFTNATNKIQVPSQSSVRRLIGKQMTVENMDSSNSHNAQKIAAKEAQRNTFKNHQQNRSIMIQPANPIGSSSDDVRFTSGRQMRDDYKRRVDSIYLGESEQKTGTRLVEVVPEQPLEDEEDKVREEPPDETEIMANLLQLDRGCNSSSERMGKVPVKLSKSDKKLNYSSPLRFNVRDNEVKDKDKLSLKDSAYGSPRHNFQVSPNASGVTLNSVDVSLSSHRESDSDMSVGRNVKCLSQQDFSNPFINVSRIDGSSKNLNSSMYAAQSSKFQSSQMPYSALSHLSNQVLNKSQKSNESQDAKILKTKQLKVFNEDRAQDDCKINLRKFNPVQDQMSSSQTNDKQKINEFLEPGFKHEKINSLMSIIPESVEQQDSSPSKKQSTVSQSENSLHAFALLKIKSRDLDQNQNQTHAYTASKTIVPENTLEPNGQVKASNLLSQRRKSKSSSKRNLFAAQNQMRNEQLLSYSSFQNVEMSQQDSSTRQKLYYPSASCIMPPINDSQQSQSALSRADSNLSTGKHLGPEKLRVSPRLRTSFQKDEEVAEKGSSRCSNNKPISRERKRRDSFRTNFAANMTSIVPNPQPHLLNPFGFNNSGGKVASFSKNRFCSDNRLNTIEYRKIDQSVNEGSDGGRGDISPRLSQKEGQGNLLNFVGSADIQARKPSQTQLPITYKIEPDQEPMLYDSPRQQKEIKLPSQKLAENRFVQPRVDLSQDDDLL